MTLDDGASLRMRAAVVVAPGRAEVLAVPRPDPGPGQVRIKVEGCGVCGSDLAVWQGRPWFDYPQDPGAPGHEAWGVVDEVGEGVRLETGTAVAALSYNGDAAYDIADAANVVPLPDPLAEGPFPGEALGCAMNVFSRSDIEAGQNVAVIGIGFMGALLTQLAARAGARVFAFSRRRFSLDVAREMGAERAVPLGGPEDAVGLLEGPTGGLLCHRVIEATGLQAPLDVATAVTGERGRLVIAGYHQDGSRTVDMQAWNWRGIDVVNAHERDPAVYVQGIRRAAAAVASGALDPAPLYTHSFSLTDAQRAFETAAARPDGFLKALIRP